MQMGVITVKRAVSPTFTTAFSGGAAKTAEQTIADESANDAAAHIEILFTLFIIPDMTYLLILFRE